MRNYALGKDLGQVREVTAGETLFQRDRSRVAWEIFQEVTKVFAAGSRGDIEPSE